MDNFDEDNVNWNNDNYVTISNDELTDYFRHSEGQSIGKEATGAAANVLYRPIHATLAHRRPETAGQVVSPPLSMHQT